jgi:heme/copper-type cytochrome/quinol oxidase subunit 3
MLALLCAFTWSGALRPMHAEQAELVSWYWHFVDGIWIVVLTVVYLVGR